VEGPARDAAAVFVARRDDPCQVNVIGPTAAECRRRTLAAHFAPETPLYRVTAANVLIPVIFATLHQR
jgi:hypothetical protein